MQICGRDIASVIRKVFTGLKINVVHPPIEPVNLWSCKLFNAWNPLKGPPNGYHTLNTSRPTLIANFYWWHLVWWCILALSTWWETKNIKISKLLNAISQQPSDQFWENLILRCILVSQSDGRPKISKSKMVNSSHLENRKIVISPKPFGRFWRHSVQWHILVLQSLPAVQKNNF